jgi:hypothetical protein
MQVEQTGGASNKNRSKLWWFVIATFIVLLVALFWYQLGYRTYNCPVIVAYVTGDDEGQGFISIYSKNESQVVLRSHTIHDIGAGMLGYDSPSQTWVFCDVFPDRLILVSKEKTIELRPQGLPKRAYLENAVLCASTIFVPRIESGVLMLYCCSLDGKITGKRRLEVPNTTVDSVEDSIYITVAPNGYVAAELKRVTAENINSRELEDKDLLLYVFDEHDQLIRKINGGGIQFSLDGYSLAYSDKTNNITILDLRTDKKRLIKVWPPVNAGIWERHFIEGLADFKWDSRHNCLLCAYEEGSGNYRPVFAIDISSDKAKWHRLPIDVDIQNWILMDKMP